MRRHIFVISDLHLGGRPRSAGGQADGVPGTQICASYDLVAEFINWVCKLALGSGVQERELVINGDLADFLLPDDWEDGTDVRVWTSDQVEACHKFEKITERAQPVMNALREFLAHGHSLTLLLGNHDVELSLPKVRALLEKHLESAGKRFRFLYDGEAYTIGRVLMEHGNRYDAWNILDYSGLRQERSMLSRGLTVLEEQRADRYFVPPPGSFLVSRFLNRLKAKFSFVNVLKPEDGAVVPLLLALEPGFRPEIQDLLTSLIILRNKRKNQFVSNAVPAAPRLIGVRDPEVWESDLRKSLGQDAYLLNQVHNQVQLSSGRDGNVSQWLKSHHAATNDSLESGLAIWRLLRSGDQNVTSRLQEALGRLNRDDSSFTVTREVDSYLGAARETAQAGNFDVIVYGHTHLPKNVSFEVSSGSGPRTCTYLNTGTWCQVMRIPPEITAAESVPGPGSSTALAAFVEAMRNNDYEQYMSTRACYAELLVDTTGNERTQAALFVFCGSQEPRRPLHEGSPCRGLG